MEKNQVQFLIPFDNISLHIHINKSINKGDVKINEINPLRCARFIDATCITNELENSPKNPV